VQRLHDHPIVVTLVAFVIAGAVVVAIAGLWGFAAFADAWRDPHYGWLAVTISAQLLAFPAYVIAYRAVALVHGGPALPMSMTWRVVTAGFGPFAVGGGFALDKLALYAIQNDRRASTVRVLGLGALEWALLAPAACVSAVVLLATGDPRPMKSLLWPWAIAVPVGFALGLWCAAPSRCQRVKARGGRWRSGVGLALDGVGVLHALAGDFSRYLGAWIGIALYWALDIASFYGAARFIGLHLSLGETVLAYATGYALTRRSMPLGGAGATEALLTFSLHWVGQPVSASLAAVVVYRLFNFLLLAIPALLARAHVEPLLHAADEDRTLPQREELGTAGPPLAGPR
jgi:uncharacterized membrane protein YbhN (UPF0104 family)